jgi:heme/copper-type cytochrome/quinol oxidase subunit 2
MMNRLTTFLTRLMVLATIVLPAGSALAGPQEIKSQTEIDSLQQIPNRILTVLMIFLPAIATFYLILTGYRYIVAQGNPELTEKAKKSLTYAVFGVVIAYASVLIIKLFADALDFPVGF